MKKLPSVKAIMFAVIVICSIEIFTKLIEGVTILSLDSAYTTMSNSVIESVMLKNQSAKMKNKTTETTTVTQTIAITALNASTPMIVYEGMTLDELAEKLNASLSGDLSGYGISYATYSLEYGVDPYLAVAISLLETGCKWKCSSLVTTKNNVGGMRSNGSYLSFNSLDEGIEAMIKNLGENYINQGLDTPELINTKYASSTEWSTKVNNYIEEIKNAI